MRVIACPDVQKVAYATHMLVDEAEYWWENTRQYLEAGGVVITWDAFKYAFLEKYFPDYVKNKKEVEFLELKQGGLSVAEYAAKLRTW